MRKLLFNSTEAAFWKNVAWICRYTSLKPEDVGKMTTVQYMIFCETLESILDKESGREGE